MQPTRLFPPRCGVCSQFREVGISVLGLKHICRDCTPHIIRADSLLRQIPGIHGTLRVSRNNLKTA